MQQCKYHTFKCPTKDEQEQFSFRRIPQTWTFFADQSPGRAPEEPRKEPPPESQERSRMAARGPAKPAPGAAAKISSPHKFYLTHLVIARRQHQSARQYTHIVYADAAKLILSPKYTLQLHPHFHEQQGPAALPVQACKVSEGWHKTFLPCTSPAPGPESKILSSDTAMTNSSPR